MPNYTNCFLINTKKPCFTLKRDCVRQKLNVTEAEEIIENLKSAWEEDSPGMYVAISRWEDERVVLIGYEDYIEVVIAKKDDVRRMSTFTEIER